MTELEERLAALQPRRAPDEIWSRARSGVKRAPRHIAIREVPMMIAAAAFIAVVLQVVAQHQEQPKGATTPAQEGPWMDRETSVRDLSPEQSREAAKLIDELGSEEQERRDAASSALRAQIGTAIPLVRKALDHADSEVAFRAKQLVVDWEKATRNRKLADAVDRAAKKALAQEHWTVRLKRPQAGEIDWRTHALAALKGDAVATEDFLAVGWHAASLVRGVADGESPALRARARNLLWAMVAQLFLETKTVTPLRAAWPAALR